MSLTPVSPRPTSGPTGLGGSTPATLLAAGIGQLSAISTNGTAALAALFWNVALSAWQGVTLLARTNITTIVPDSTKNGGIDYGNFNVPLPGYYCAWLTSTPPENNIANLTVDIEGVAAGTSGITVVTHAMTPYFVTPTDRYLLVDTSGGVVTVKMPGTPTAPSALQIVDALRSFGTNALTIDGNGHNVNGAGTLVVNTTDDCPLVLYGGTTWEVTPGTASIPFDPASPGPIGGTTPSTIKGTTITATVGVSLPTSIIPAGLTGAVQLVSATNKTLDIIDAAGDALILEQLSVTGTAKIVKRFLAVSLADDAAVDIALLGASLGGYGTATAPAATTSVFGAFSYAANAATFLGGQTYTNFDVADTDTKLCVFASAGNLHVRNRLGSTQTILVELTELLHL